MRSLRTIVGFALVGALLGACSTAIPGSHQVASSDAPSIGAIAGAVVATVGKLLQIL